MGSEVSNARVIGRDEFPVLELLPCFVKGRIGTPQTVNLNRVLLPSGEALSSFASNLHFMGGKLQPFMDFAVGADAEVANRFSFLNAGAQVASSQRDASAINVAGRRAMARLVLLANH